MEREVRLDGPAALMSLALAVAQHNPRFSLSTRIAFRICRPSVRLFSENKHRTDKFTPGDLPQPHTPERKYYRFIYSGLLVFGLGLTAYGFYDVMNMWPSHLRKNLRQGLYAKRKGDLDSAILHLSRAWQDTKSTPLETFGRDPLLKISGVAITFAGVLEDGGLIERAYQTYQEALFVTGKLSLPNTETESLKSKLSTSEDKIRAASISYKLGELANKLQKPLEEEEKWLSLSVEVLLTVSPERSGIEIRDTLEGLELPEWAILNDFAAPFEALGSFYARMGKIDYASLLYSQAIGYLLHSGSGRSSTVEDKCRGAQLMGNLAELTLRSYPSDSVPPEVLTNAEVRLKGALELTQAARKSDMFTKHELCEEVYAVLLYNFAMVRQFAGDVDTARDYFRQSLHQANTINMQEGVSNAETALSQLDVGK